MEEDQEHKRKRSKDRSPSPGVKSTAIVKYTSVQSPVEYAKLQCNTDLNLPPSNWSAAIDSYGLKRILTKGGMSSFRMAHMFPDCVGNVDVISGAECIKKLLKLPYQPNGTVSIMVHRLENTLLLDEFEIYDYLLKSEWSWLKDFFYENILKTMSEQEKVSLKIDNKASTSLQLTSKFLCHSVANSTGENEIEKIVEQAVLVDGPHLPEPEPTNQCPPNDHLYNRNVLWTFEDIHMLIGSDLPIFGGQDRPCVSLRLRDAREPINVLTGIDYWLDNLMCNVPEVLMCYHIDGIVQKYEPMKTEDLPNMDHSKFSPKVIRNVAQNILSFLKSNATKAGHTYWLFKGPHDDVVKLYDLTSLCPDDLDNPFTTPVAMLLYRVARNMRLTNRKRKVKELLSNTIKLLKVERHPQIVASAHYMLADLYLPATTDPAMPCFKAEESSSDSECEFEEADTQNQLVQARGLTLRNIGDRSRELPKQKRKKDSKVLSVNPPDRCGKALEHSLKGLQALHHVTIDRSKEEERERLKQQIINEEQNPKMANPYEPIKMNYEPLEKTKEEPRGRRRRRKNSDRKTETNQKQDKKQQKKSNDKKPDDLKSADKNAIVIRKENLHPTLTEPNRDDNFAWKMHLKTLLYEKICLGYATLAEYSYANEHYGFSLKHIEMASKCQKLLQNLIIKSRVVDPSCLLGRVGDNYFQISKHWSHLEVFKKQYGTDHDLDLKIKAEIYNDLIEETGVDEKGNFDLDISFPPSETESMCLSCDYYDKAIAVSDCDKMAELQRRLASVNNELGVRYMNEAQQIYIQYTEQQDAKDSDKCKKLYKQFDTISQKSWRCLSIATDIFANVNDVSNLALLYCNQGRYKRFKAHCDIGYTNSEKRSLYSQAEDLYKQALSVLDGHTDAGSNSVRDLVKWEFSCHLYTKATYMQDCADQYGAEANEVAEVMKQALKQCPLTPGPRQCLYQFRAAVIYHRLGSLYHSQYRLTKEDGPKRRTLFNSTRNNYELSANMFASLEDAHMCLTVRLEHVALLETQAHVSTSLKLKSLQTALQILRQSQSILKLINQSESQEDRESPEKDSNTNEGNTHSLLTLYESRLQCILKNIIQYCRTKSNKDYEKLSDLYKKMYCASLKIKKNINVKLYAESICEVLVELDVLSNDG